MAKTAPKTASPAKSLTAAKGAMSQKLTTLFDAVERNMPAEAQLEGYHAFTVRDDIAGRKTGILDGWYARGGMAIRIKGGRPATVVRAGHPHFPVDPKTF